MSTKVVENATSLDAAKHINTYINNYIHQADVKSRLLLTADTAMLWVSVTRLQSAEGAARLLIYVAVGAMVVAACLALYVILPGLDKQQNGHHVFWVNILDQFKSSSAYADSFARLDSAALAREMCDENYCIARIARRKYRWFVVATLLTAVGVIAAVAAAANSGGSLPTLQLGDLRNESLNPFR